MIQYQQYVLSAKYVVPLIGLFAVFQFMYNLPPAEIVSSYAIMGLVLFARDILVLDITGGILLMFACSFVGSMVGGIVAEVPISKYILWITFSRRVAAFPKLLPSLK